MNHVFKRTQNALFYFLLLIIGLYSGMHFFHEMCPVESQMSPIDYARYWKIVDGTFMHQRMGVMAPLMLGLFVLNIIVNLKQWRSSRFLLLTTSFVFLLMDVALTVTEQLPINLFINELNLEHISSNEMMLLKKYQIIAIENFQNRFWFALASFAFLSLVPFSNIMTSKKEITPLLAN